MTETFQERLYRIVAQVLDVPVSALTADASPDTLRQWDSVSHLNLIVALESEFGIAFTDDDVAEMLSLSLIQTILAERGADAGAPR